MELKNMQNKLEGEVTRLNEAHSKTLEELAWKHHVAIEAVHSNAARDRNTLQVVSKPGLPVALHWCAVSRHKCGLSCGDRVCFSW